MKCVSCGKEFQAASPSQKYCSKECLVYGSNHRLARPPYEFYCAHCGKHVVTAPYNDRRSRFCSRNCEKKYWRHPERHRLRGNLGMSGAMSLGRLIKRERRSLY